jgi:hypothetical protein
VKKEFVASYYSIGIVVTVFLRNVLRLPVTANVVPSSPIVLTLMMEAIRSFKTSVTKATWRNIPGDGIHHSHRRENLKPYKELTG